MPSAIETAPVLDHGCVLYEVKGNDREAIRDTLRHILNLSPRDHLKFPGPSPVSIERADLSSLRAAPYLGCEKTDGWRAFMMLSNFKGVDVCCVFDRKLTPYVCYLQYVPTALWQGSAFDGEIVWNHREKRWTFLIFDALRVSGIPIYLRPFGERVHVARQAWQAYVFSESDMFDVRVKEFVPAEEIRKLPDHVHRMQKEYRTDGIILTPDVPDVVFGRHRGLFKLKTEGKHTVDFLVADDGRGLCVYDLTRSTHVEVGKLCDGEQQPGTIVECVQSQGQQEWRVVHVRTDKNHANDMLTYKKTLLNMEEALTMEDVLNAF